MGGTTAVGGPTGMDEDAWNIASGGALPCLVVARERGVGFLPAVGGWALFD
ncbi:hypothetical protein [Streptomyces erythrochromogenes]|uniref:hypothetical protein n=1 Tax=Streptomyces erythrochromogenes TaxID=285574 RepID=UPI00386CE1EC|nr:hypothetical protein OG364_09645 [Streptomyces erythrochromogenes]